MASSRSFFFPFGVILALICVCSLPARGDGPATRVAPKVAFAQYVHLRAQAILDAAEAGNDFMAAAKAADNLFQLTALYANTDQLEPFREADFTLRLMILFSRADRERRVQLLQYLRKNTDLAGTLVFLASPGSEKSPQILAQLDALRQKHADELNKYACLAAAVCVVHATPFSRHINENQVIAPDPLEIYEYYVKHEKQMLFGIRNVPAELLVYVVDDTASIPEMEWALAKYAGDKEVGKRFFDIKYDLDAMRHGTQKMVTKEGYNLQNILKYGGICADQSYFACSVGKAIGVPTAYTVGVSAQTGHAWVGFLQAAEASAAWNFDTGRYSAYQGLRGTVMDPQMQHWIPDNYVSLTGELIGTRPVDRQNSAAITDIARLLLTWERGYVMVGARGDATMPVTVPVIDPPPECIAGTFRAGPRSVQVGLILSLVELALRQSAGYAPAWFEIRDLAVDKKLSLADKRRWADLLAKLGAQKYPDFTLSILMPMVQTVDDVPEQDKLWNSAADMFKKRFDLVGAIRMEQAAMWEKQKQPDKAGLIYMDVIDHYANSGPFIIGALKGAEALLKSTNRSDKVVTLYDQTWNKIKQPQEMDTQLLAQSTWFRVGKLYAQKLEDAGDNAKAQSILAKIGVSGGHAATP